MNRDVLDHRLRRAFDGEPGEFRAVVRMAGDLSDSGQYRADVGSRLSPDRIVEHLRESPDGSVSDRWNWWMGSLEYAFGGYTRFQVWAWEV